jgi:hypothetical protein
VFEQASAEILALKADDIMLVKDGFAAKILAAERIGSQTVLIIDCVKLVKLVQEGEIHLEPSISRSRQRTIHASGSSKKNTISYRKPSLKKLRKAVVRYQRIT